MFKSILAQAVRVHENPKWGVSVFAVCPKDFAAAGFFKFLAFENHQPPTTIISTFILHNYVFKNRKHTFTFFIYSITTFFIYICWYAGIIKINIRKIKEKALPAIQPANIF
jgi:hypothetical protein